MGDASSSRGHGTYERSNISALERWGSVRTPRSRKSRIRIEIRLSGGSDWKRSEHPHAVPFPSLPPANEPSEQPARADAVHRVPCRAPRPTLPPPAQIGPPAHRADCDLRAIDPRREGRNLISGAARLGDVTPPRGLPRIRVFLPVKRTTSRAIVASDLGGPRLRGFRLSAGK